MAKQKVKAILFDMDGVLIDSANAWFYTMNDTLQHFGFRKITYKYFLKAFGSPIEEDAKTLFHGKTVKEIADFYDARFKIRINKVKLFRDAMPTLRKLKARRIKLALLTNSTRYITNLILNHFKLKKYFGAVVTMEDVKRSKPAPDLVIEACKRLGVNARDTILVGDTKYDTIAGKRAGVVTVGYKVKGDYKVNRLKNIINYVSNQ